MSNVGSDGTKFTAEVHHDGFFCGTAKNRTYLGEKISFFDGIEAASWCYVMVEELILLLGYLLERNLKVYWLLPGKDLKDGLRIIISDTETNVMRLTVHKVTTFVLYFDHHSHVAGNQHLEVVVASPIVQLPKVLSPRKMNQMDKMMGLTM